MAGGTSAVRTNNVAVAYVEEETLGVLPSSPEWQFLEPDGIPTFGATIATSRREPISPDRQLRQGSVTDLDSAVEIGADLTLSSFLDFAEGFLFSTFTSIPSFFPTAVTGTAYTVAAGGALAAGTLVFARGFETAGNNGLKEVASGSTATAINIEGGLTVEASPPTGAQVEVCGVRGAVGDLEIDSDGNLISTALDFTTLGLTVGQGIRIGGAVAANQFASAENVGLARIRVIEANKLTLDKRQQAYTTDNGATKEIDVYFGPFLRNYPTSNSLFAERCYQFEISYPNLIQPSGNTGYEYAIGNLANELTIDMPLSDLSTGTFSFIGQDTEPTTETRKGGTFSTPTKTAALSTTADFLRLRIQQQDETGLTTFFKAATFNINNNVSPEKVIGRLGAAFMNFGNFVVSLTTQVLFTSAAVVSAVRNNETVGLDFALANSDGALYYDVPSLNLGDGAKDFPLNETVQINLTGEAFIDDFFGYTLGVTHFPYLPSS